jgi:hypothetical protein
MLELNNMIERKLAWVTKHSVEAPLFVYTGSCGENVIPASACSITQTCNCHDPSQQGGRIFFA